MKRTIFLLTIAFIAFNNLYSQDTIVKTDNERIICKIKEIGSDEIKYQPFNDNIIIGIDKNKVSKVVLASGMIMNFHNSMDDPEHYKDNNKDCIKFSLLSPLYGYSGFSWEHSIKPGSSFECSLGIIGLGRNTNSTLSTVGNCYGATIRLGYKFIKTPDFYLKGLQYAQVLKGLYFRPEIILSDYNQPSYYSIFSYGISTSTSSNNVFNGAILFNIGYQWIFNNLIAVDIFSGLGFGISSNSGNLLGTTQYYGYYIGPSSFPIAISTGFRIGFLFK